MKTNALKGLCLGTALVLLMGISPLSVLAAEVDGVETVTETLDTTNLYSPRLTQPTADNAYYYANNAYYQGGYGLPNCTAYAFGRAYELLGTEPNLPMDDAGNWWADNLASGAYPTGQTPKLGAIICWNGSYSGHVAVVEAINGDQVTLSESAWSGPIFNSYTYTIGMEDATSVGGFQGYIYIGDFADTNTETVAPTLEKVRISEVDDQGFTVTATVSDADSGIKKVRVPVWTAAGGQDDVIWYDATVEGDQVSCQVLYSEHNDEQGDYVIHVYAYDNAGNKTIAKTATLINTVYPTITDAQELIATPASSNSLPVIS
ncbi:GBS Bsp-like repeat-containing protein [Eubacteriaceae bacterium ES2]|nr:GBS Bsp-like repeat-containing protein [Eubacteriaceae bacterium ES2]